MYLLKLHKFGRLAPHDVCYMIKLGAVNAGSVRYTSCIPPSVQALTRQELCDPQDVSFCKSKGAEERDWR